MTATLTETDTETTTTTDTPIVAHVVNCPEGKESTQAWLTEARVFGLEVEALCGYRWVPSRDPENKPVCTACLEEMERIIHND